jgi:hypothetical protein
MLAFVDLIHALPTRGRKVPNSCFQGEFCIKKQKFGRNAFVQGELAFMHLGAQKYICSGGTCIHAFGSSFSPEF